MTLSEIAGTRPASRIESTTRVPPGTNSSMIRSRATCFATSIRVCPTSRSLSRLPGATSCLAFPFRESRERAKFLSHCNSLKIGDVDRWGAGLRGQGCRSVRKWLANFLQLAQKSTDGLWLEAEALQAGVELGAGDSEDLCGLGLVPSGLVEDVEHDAFFPFGKGLARWGFRRDGLSASIWK